jgi:hypothetical protein
MIGSNSISMDANGYSIKAHKYPTSHSDLAMRLKSMRAFPPHSSLMYRRDVVVRLSAFNSRYVQSEDYDLWLRLSEVGKVAAVGKPLVKIRKHEQNISNTEGGMLQTRLAFAASVCHFLRINGCPDPSINNNETIWREFVTWIDDRMIGENVFEKRKAWVDARAEYFATANRLTSALRFSAHFLKSGHASPLMLEKFFGSSLPQRLAQEWMAISN